MRARMLLWAGLLGAGCAGGDKDASGIIVRQVLSGSATTPAASAPAAVGPTGIGGSTLVADTPRALYRRAFDQSRRRADGETPRERLAALDESIDASMP